MTLYNIITKNEKDLQIECHLNGLDTLVKMYCVTRVS